ncbi:MAG: lipopolysaccharide biosynthesis protein [Anaerolineae bacterium]
MSIHQPLSKRVSGAVFWNTLIIPIRAVLSLLSSVVVVRALGTESYAIYALVISTAATVVAFGGLGLDVSIQKFIPEVYKRNARPGSVAFLKTVILIKLGIFTAIVVLLNLFPTFFARLFSINTTVRFFLAIVGVITLFQAGADSLEAFLTSMFDRKSTNINNLVASVLKPSLVIAAVLLGQELAGIFVSIALSEAVRLSLNFLSSRRVLSTMEDTAQERFNFDRLRGRWLSFCGFTYYEKLTRYVISPPFIILLLAQFLDKTEVAIFALAADFTIRFLSLLLSPTYGIFMPLFATTYGDSDDRRLHQTYPLTVKFLALIFIPAGAGLIVISRNLFAILYPQAFSQSVPVAQILIAFLFLDVVISTPTATLFHSYEKYRPVIISRFISLAGVASLLVIIPAYRVLGATILYGTGTLLTSLFLVTISRRQLRLQLPKEVLLKVLGASIVYALGLEVLATRLSPTVGWTLLLIGLGVVLFIISFKAMGGLAREDKETIVNNLPSLKPVMKFL